MLEKLAENWLKIKEYILDEYDLSEVSYRTWILPLKIGSLNENVLKIAFPAGNDDMTSPEFVINYITKKYSLAFQVAIEEIIGEKFQIVFVMEEKNHESLLFHREGKPSSDLKSTLFYRSTRLNSKYTFDNFVVGASNRFAHAAAVSVAENPGREFNPLFIYGGPGLGKTHLMQSIAHFILHKNPETRIIYATSEDFTNEVIDSIRNKNAAQFREKYRNVDVILIDDIQFLIGKDSTQEEFFHTFNILYENGKQIILSSDQPPKNFESLEERLRSRFECGLTVEITSPDYETRMAILRKKEDVEGYAIDDQILQYIATNIKTNIRDLEGALQKVWAYSKFYPTKTITIETAKEILKDTISEEKKLTPEYIIRVVAEHYGLRPEDITSKKQTRDVTLPRQVASYFIRLLIDMKQEQVGSYFGGQDHSTVSYSFNKVLKSIAEDESFKQTIEIIKKKLSQ